ncbi:MAG: hypothetical protein COZ21_05060 [Bacteroidetes bacterium CG_4_10_14_3_um_filter_31_20]|nr:MAG: hypothetical protein COZ21_05060 [Bacteroidetes bacterium CG_4_10_14_3_um_filter_31_20]
MKNEKGYRNFFLKKHNVLEVKKDNQEQKQLKFQKHYLVTTQPVQRVHKQIFATDYADVTD